MQATRVLLGCLIMLGGQSSYMMIYVVDFHSGCQRSCVSYIMVHMFFKCWQGLAILSIILRITCYEIMGVIMLFSCC